MRWVTFLEAIKRQRASWEARRDEVSRRLVALRREQIALTDHLRSIEAHCDAARMAEEAARELDSGVTADGRPVRSGSGAG